MFFHRSRFLLTLLILAAAAVYAFAADQPPAPGKEPAKKPVDTGGKTAGATGGVVVFVDPATGQIRQPDASEIGALAPPAGPAPKAPEPALIQGPGGAVGVRLGADSLTYMVVTTAPDGKLAMDCVTGEKAAAAVTAGPAPKASLATTASPAPKAKDAPKTPQDTHDVKVPR